MADKSFHVEIVTPQSMVFSGEATLVALPGILAPFQVLVNHAPIVTQLEVGTIKIEREGADDILYATSGGFVEHNHNRMTVVAETIETVDEIDANRAERARERALERIQQSRVGHDGRIDIVRAEAALARAINRLKMTGKL